jgi:lysozyme
MTRSIPQCAVDFVSQHEGLRLNAYPDPATGGDPWTIGYGSTGPNVKPGSGSARARR